MPSINFEVSDYEEDFRNYYCNDIFCLNKECGNGLKDALMEYLEELYKNLYLYSESNVKIKTAEDIYNDLSRIIGGN